MCVDFIEKSLMRLIHIQQLVVDGTLVPTDQLEEALETVAMGTRDAAAVEQGVDPVWHVHHTMNKDGDFLMDLQKMEDDA